MGLFKSKAEKAEDLHNAGEWVKSQQMRCKEHRRQHGNCAFDETEETLVKLILRRQTLLQRESALLNQQNELCDYGQPGNPGFLMEKMKIELQLLMVRQDIRALILDELYVERRIPEGGLLDRGMTCTTLRKVGHMTEWLKKDCASRGGCCGRSCGCCARPRSQTRFPNLGHCTGACQCCEKKRAIGVEYPIWPWDIGMFDGTKYRQQMVDAYIWGIL